MVENASKWLDYHAVVYRGAVLAFCRCCHSTGRWLAALGRWVMYLCIPTPCLDAFWHAVPTSLHIFNTVVHG